MVSKKQLEESLQTWKIIGTTFVIGFVIVFACLFICSITSYNKNTDLKQKISICEDSLDFERVAWRCIDELPKGVITPRIDYKGCWKYYKGYLYFTNNSGCHECFEELIK